MARTLLYLLLPTISLATEISGSWSIKQVRFGEEGSPMRAEFKVDGTKLSGSMNDWKLEGTFQNDSLVFNVVNPSGKTVAEFKGKAQGDQMAGTVVSDNEESVWKAARQTKLANTSPQTHRFEPTKFHRLFSGTIPAELRLSPGDTVITTTVDAGGVDSKGVRRSLGGNPQTGPFYVEGAMPGDTLVVKFKRIRLNRDSARSGDRITSSALTANYARNAKYEDNFNSEWKLDRQEGYASLAKPTERLKNFKVKLQPMLGCVAVAPANKQAFRTGWPGSFGGNMDYNGLREGVTVYLPVNQEGALLFVGDGHAVQGDGELNGDALETSMDVEFTVDLIRGSNTQAPRMESDEFLMASGIQNSLPEALQQATTELARWLERDYKLTANESAIVLGTSIKYDIAEVVDPQIHVVAKISKVLLETLK